MGVSMDRERKRATQFVELESPFGTVVEVTQERAEAFLNRPPVQRGDGTWHRYVELGEDTQVPPEDVNTLTKKSLLAEKHGTPGGGKAAGEK